MSGGQALVAALPDARSVVARRPLLAALALPLGAGLCAFAVYVATLAPTIGYLDGPELSAAVLTLGVAHPTGYPLYTLLGHGFAQLVAVGDPAWRLNLLSALCGGLAVALLVAVARKLSGSAPGAWLAGMLFAFSSSFWSQCTIVEVYALHALLVALVLGCWLRFDERGGPRELAALAAVSGLALTHHLMTLLLGPALALGVLARWRGWLSPRALLVAALCLVAPLALYLYLPVAAGRDPLVNWGDPSTPARFWLHVSGAQYHGLVEAPRSVVALLVAYVRGLSSEFGVPLVGLALLGLARARRQARRFAVLGLAFASSLGFAISYGVADPEPFFLSANLVLSLFTACGAAFAIERAGASWPRCAATLRALCWLAPLLVLLGNFREQDRRDDYEAHDRAMAVLSTAPPDATLLTQGSRGYPPVYASLVEGVRPDVEVVDMYLRVRNRYASALERVRHAPLPAGWTRDMAVAVAAAQQQGGRRPLLLWPEAPDLDWSALGLFRVRGGIVDRLLREPPDLRAPRAKDASPTRERSPIAFRGGPALVALDARRAGRPARIAAGTPLELEYRWRLGEASGNGPLSVTTLLAHPNGDVVEASKGAPVFAREHPLGQGAGLARYRPGELIAERRLVLVPRAVAAGAYSLWVGLRAGDRWLPLDDGRAFAPALQLEVLPPRPALWRAVAPAPSD